MGTAHGLYRYTDFNAATPAVGAHQTGRAGGGSGGDRYTMGKQSGSPERYGDGDFGGYEAGSYTRPLLSFNLSRF